MGAGLFFLLSLAVTLVMFWPAAIGKKILAPLDIPPHLFAKYHYVDPTAKGVPANHYVIDLILGDVSRNLLVHQAWRRGEMPWWDPYINGGKPLAAEANAVNVSDPFKVVLFHLLPFELAYNWIRLVPFVLSGLLAFWLFRHLDFGFTPALWGGLLYQFAGCNVMLFSGPTIQASFAYYPLLWLLWDRGVAQGKLFWFAVSAGVTALIFLSGNLQSHSYLFPFAGAFVVGYGWRQRHRWWLLLSGTGLAITGGLTLAAPFLFAQVEMFLLSASRLHAEASSLSLLSGVASLSAFFPWALGTFRTLDLSKAFGQSGLGFWIYIGSAALVLAVLGLGAKAAPGTRPADVKRTALALLAVYFLICSTPLLKIFYTRIAWLPVLGLLVLMMFGWNRLMEYSSSLKRWGWVIICISVLVVAGLNVGGLVLYPRYQAQIEARVLQQGGAGPSFDAAPPLRQFQVANFPNEVTFRNRETFVAFLGLMVLGVFLLRRPARPQFWLNTILILSTLPLLWYGQRYIPMQPRVLWERIRAGGPEQQRVLAATRTDGLRLNETAAGQHEHVFPGAMAQLYQVHVLQGQSSLTLRHAGTLTQPGERVDPARYDYEYRSPERGMERGELVRSPASTPARFFWAQPMDRAVAITGETLNTITLEIGPGAAGELIRTDTYYPGWRIDSGPAGAQMKFESPCFARLQVPAGPARLTLRYEPRWWRTGICVALAGAVLLTVLLVVDVKRRKQCPQTTRAA